MDSAPLTATGNLRRRQVVSALAQWSATGCAVLAVAVLGVVVASVAVRGAAALSLDFVTKDPPLFGGSGGGIAPAIVGTAIIIGIATAIAAPVGILVAVYLTEFASPRAVCEQAPNGWLPLAAAADALGVARWRSVLSVVLPSALGGILTGTALAVARGAGETAPLILCSSIYPNTVSLDPFHAMPNIPVQIFTLSEAADPQGFTRAWGAALVLLAFILVTNVAGRALLARSRAKLTR
jgi:phosphate transport system permease protein